MSTERHKESSPTAEMAGARLLHTMLRVSDLNRALDFYTRSLGMRLLRRQDFEGGQFTLAFVGYGPESETAVLELTHNWGTRDYTAGTGYGHVAIGVRDVMSATQALAAEGVKVTRPAGPLKGDPREIISFVEDPDGYKIELIQR